MAAPQTRFRRSPHDKENPYVQLNRDLFRRKDVSPECLYLIAHLLSHKDGWEINAAQLVNFFHGRWGRDKVYKLIKEAMRHGYIERVAIKCDKSFKGRKGAYESFIYYVSETPILNKSLVLPENQDPCLQDPCNTHIKKEYDSLPIDFLDKKEHIQEQVANAPAVTDYLQEFHDEFESLAHHGPPLNSSPDVVEELTASLSNANAKILAQAFFEALKARFPKLKHPNMTTWTLDCDKLLRIDQRQIAEVSRVIEWMSTAKWYKSNILSPAAFRKHYDRMLANMMESTEQERIRANRAWALAMRDKYPQELKGLTFDANFAMNKTAAKELSFNMMPEAFKEAFPRLFGGELC